MRKTFTAYQSIAIAIFIVGCMSSCYTLKRISCRMVITLQEICKEGYNLYVSEHVNWVSSDSLLAHYSVDDIGGKIIWQPTDSTWNAMFLDTEQKNAIFELKYNIKSKHQVISYDIRPVTEMEKTVLEKQNTMFRNAIDQYGDSLRYNSDYGRPNFDFVRIDANTTRMYMLQGVERSGIIPFGNDISIDFDNNCKITAFRRYHRSFIPVSNDGEVAFHSHLRDNPYITPTDICNFLLYRGKMKQTYILSTAHKGYIIYDAESNSAEFIPKGDMKKIIKNKPQATP